MKQLFRFLAMTIIATAGTGYAGEAFMHSSSWGLMMNDDNPNQEYYHYNTFSEDINHACNGSLSGYLGA